MPILTSGGVDLTGRGIRIPGLADFNAGDADYIITDVEGYMDAASPSPVLVANGGGAGAVGVGDWEPGEDYLTLAGHIFAPAFALAEMQRALVAAFRPEVESPLVILGGGMDADKQMFVRLYDRRTINQLDDRLSFVLPLVAPDPYRYGLAPLVGDVGVFTGQKWFREYVAAGTKWVREYALVGTKWVREYAQAVSSGPYPQSVTLASKGDAVSRRVTVTVTGPVAAGDWWVVNESTGERLWVDVSVSTDQTLVLDSHLRTARLNGSPVDHLVFGDFPTLGPGGNLFRLVSGTASSAYASVEAFEAYQ